MLIFDNVMSIRKFKVTKPIISDNGYKNNKAQYSSQLAKMTSKNGYILILLTNYNRVTTTDRVTNTKLTYIQIRNEYKMQ